MINKVDSYQQNSESTICAKLCFIIIIDLLHISEVLQEYISLYGGQRVPFYAEFSENNFYFPIISSKFKCYNIFGKKFLRASSSINLQITSGVLSQMTSLGLLLHKNRIQIKFSYYLIIVNFLKKKITIVQIMRELYSNSLFFPLLLLDQAPFCLS